MKKFLAILSVCALALTGCMKEDKVVENGFDVKPAPGSGLFIACQGNWSYGNATLSFYDTKTKVVENELFARANDQKLGDTAQSMTLHDGTLWIVVNTSNVIFAIDPYTFKEKGRITGFASPREIFFVSDDKAYVTQMEDGRICIVDPKKYEITGYIETSEAVTSTEQIEDFGSYVITNCWSYQKKILKIDTATDKVTGELEVGIQPSDIARDRNGKLWVLTDGGGWDGNPIGFESPTLSRINPETLSVEKTFTFDGAVSPSKLVTDNNGDNLYYLGAGVWKMSVSADALPTEPLVGNLGYGIYALGVCPWDSDIYVADAIDWQQSGSVFRYSSDGTLKDEFKVGIIPGSFCWY